MLSDYYYELPEEAIAQTPLKDRSGSKLMWLHRGSGEIEHLKFSQVPNILKRGDLVVLNNTRVSALRLFGKTESKGKVEALLLKKLGPGRYSFIGKPGRKLRPGAKISFGPELQGEVAAGEQGNYLLFRGHKADEAIRKIGRVPLPPYIREPLPDPERYQTVFAETEGSAASPTAGLHFTIDILSALKANGVNVAYATLDVGLDTFSPMRSESIEDHTMHGEICELPLATVEAVRECEGRIIAVGTTAVRTLESFAVGHRSLESGKKETRLFIRPGYQFQIVDGMFTNFHMPHTTMLVMLAALVCREKLFEAYEVALNEQYRFLSFGDSMLIL